MFSLSKARWEAKVKVGIALLACFFMLSNCICAQASAEPLFINYTSGNRLNCLALGEGNAWLGSQGGLVRFNPQTGQRLKFTPADWGGLCCVGEIAIDSRGVLWASHEDLIGNHEPGVVEFDGVQWQWYEALPDPGAPAEEIYALVADELGYVWFQYGGDLVRFDGAAWDSWQLGLWRMTARHGRGWGLTLDTVCMVEGFDVSCTGTIPEYGGSRPVAPDRDNGVWFTTCRRYLVHYDGESFTTFNLPGADQWTGAGMLRIDDNNTKWAIGLISGEPGYRGDAASLSQDGVWQVYRNVWPSLVPIDNLADLRFDSSNTAWIASGFPLTQYGQPQPFLIRYDGRAMDSFWAFDPVVDTKVEQLCIDAEGGVWFATSHVRYTTDGWHLLDFLTHLIDGSYEILWPGHRELPDVIYSMAAAPNGDVWFGTTEGLYMFDGQEWHCHSHAAVTKVKIAPDGQVWIIWVVSQYERRAQRFDGTKWWNAYRPDWWAQELSDVAFDSNGVVWFSCDANFYYDQEDNRVPDNYAGIRSWDGENERKYLTGDGYDAIAVDQNDVVWATCGGLARIENGRAEIVPLEQLGNCSTYGPLLIDSQGRKWCRSHHNLGGYEYQPGLLCIDQNDEVRFYSTSDGLCSDAVNDIDEDAYGNIWVSTVRGISVLVEESSFVLGAAALVDDRIPANLSASTSVSYLGPPTNADLYAAIQAPSGQIFYVAPQGAEPAFPIFYAAFEGSTEFLKPGPDYTGPGSMPNTPDMKDLAPPALPVPDPPAGQGPTGLALFAYPVPYFSNVPLPAYSAIEDFVLLNTTLPETAPAGTYTFHVGITAPSSISNVYRTASCTFEVSR